MSGVFILKVHKIVCQLFNHLFFAMRITKTYLLAISILKIPVVRVRFD